MKSNVHVMIALAAVTLSLAASAQAVEFPRPTGRNAVGRMVIQVKDDDRPETWTEDPEDARQINLTVWYPAKPVAEAETAPYAAVIGDKMPPMLALENARAKKLKIYSLAGSPPPADIPEKFPVLFFSPGADMSPFGYASITEELASHGFVVVGLDHVYEGKGQVLTNGTVVEPLADKLRPKLTGDGAAQAHHDFYQKRLDIRAADVRSAMPILKMMNSRGPDAKFYRRLDLDRIGIFGHSIGGVASGQAAMQMKEIKAVANLDGLFAGLPFPAQEGKSDLKQPFLYIGKPLNLSASDEQLKQWNVTREEYERGAQLQLERNTAALKSIPGGAFRVTIPGAFHSDFSDEPYLKGNPEDAERREAVTQITRDYLRAFFSKHLMGRDPSFLEKPISIPGKLETEIFPSH